MNVSNAYTDNSLYWMRKKNGVNYQLTGGFRGELSSVTGPYSANRYMFYATTDRAKGTLKQLADAQGWPTFVVPDDVGGRYSVLSAVGLLPIAAAGISIDDVMKGAADAMERFSVLSPDNDAYKYEIGRAHV